MNRQRMNILYSGRVQGVGFRMTACGVATGYEVTGTVANLPNGQVRLIAEGTREELEAFREGVRSAGLKRFIHGEQVSWSEASGEYRGFEIIRM